MRRAAATLAVVVAGLPAVAGPGVPGADYFTGLYSRVGRDGGNPSGLIDDEVLVMPDGGNLAIEECGGGRTKLVFSPFSEIENLLEGNTAQGWLYCLFHNNGQNYPILTCQAEDGALYTLWPLEDRFADTSLDCG